MTPLRNCKIRLLAGIATFMFVTGLVYGALSGSFALTATADDNASSFGDSEATGTAEKSACLSDPAVLEEIKEQKEGIAKSRKDLEAKEAELKEREKAMADELAKVQTIRDEINKTTELRKKENEEKVAKIIDTIGTMSPKSSAKILAELDDALAVEVMNKLDTDKLSKIMNLLDPKRASALTEMLAGVAHARAGAKVAYADSATGRDSSAKGLIRKGGDNNDEQNNVNSNNGNSSRKPSSISGKNPGSRQ